MKTMMNEEETIMSNDTTVAGEDTCHMVATITEAYDFGRNSFPM